MKIEKSAMAGTLESSDAQVTIEPASGLELNIQSSVLNQYGRQIKYRSGNAGSAGCQGCQGHHRG